MTHLWRHVSTWAWNLLGSASHWTATRSTHQHFLSSSISSPMGRHAVRKQSDKTRIVMSKILTILYLQFNILEQKELNWSRLNNKFLFHWSRLVFSDESSSSIYGCHEMRFILYDSICWEGVACQETSPRLTSIPFCHPLHCIAQRRGRLHKQTRDKTSSNFVDTCVVCQ